jgi:hypothetical protein
MVTEFITNADKMSSTRPLRVTSMRGHVTAGLYAKGSKSEHEAIFIETSHRRYVLRYKNDHAFNYDKLKQFMGHEVECDGFVVGTTLLAERIDIID